ncbi:MAG: hypothetical protein K0S82_30 [Gaiellaceae bacterium]|jgi:hypothetical protein|nr:hypothetical protein [Gaiellaceae bacterium]
MLAFHQVYEIPSWGSWTLIEIIWLATGLIALMFSLARIRSLVWDYQDAVAVGEDDLRLIARAHLRREVIRIAQGVAIVGIGLYVGLQEQMVPGPARVTTGGLVLTAGLIWIAAGIALQSALDWRARSQVIDILRSSRHA